MTPAPDVIVFDVNETLSDLRPMGERFEAVGLAAHQSPTWFAQVLRDGFALAAAGGQAPFADVAAGVLRTLLAAGDQDGDADAAVEHVLQGFRELPVHPDVPVGVRALASAGHRLVTLTNGSTSVSEALLSGAGVRDAFERLLSVEDAGVWKPGAGAYAYAAEQCGVPLSSMLLVAVHPWDIDGAARAGLSTAWVDRSGAPYPSSFRSPTLTVTGLDDLARRLA